MKRQVWSLVLVTALFAGSLSPDMASAKKKQPSLAKSKVSLSFYGNTASAKVKVKNIAKNAKVTISQPKKTKKLLKISFRKKTKQIVVKGKRGAKNTNVTVLICQGKKKYKKKLKISCSYIKKTPAATKTPVATKMPAVTAPVQTSTPTAVPTASPTVTPTPEPVATPHADRKAIPEPSAGEKAACPTYKASYTGDSEKPLKDVYQKYFKVGAALNGSSLSTMALNHQGMTGVLLKHFNSTVLSNLMKPECLLDKEATQNSSDGMPVCRYDTCDPALQFCMDNGIEMRGHTLVWHNQVPEWFFYEDYDTTKSLADADTVDARMESYIGQVIKHCQKYFPGVIYCWDVVNECVCVDKNSYIVTSSGWKLRAATKKDNDFTHNEAKKNLWYAAMGEAYVANAFRYARKYADPDVKLFYNDYNVYQTEKMENIYKMVMELKEKGLIDGIGLQPTVGLQSPSLDSDKEGSFKTCLKKYGQTGLEIQVTELSFDIPLIADWMYIPSDEQLQAQADRYEEMMRLLLKMDTDNGGPCNITSVTVFGICDDYPLYENNHQNKYLWDTDCVPKASFYSFLKPGLELQ